MLVEQSKINEFDKTLKIKQNTRYLEFEYKIKLTYLLRERLSLRFEKRIE